MDVVNDLETEVLSCRRVGLKASADGCLVVHKDPDGFDVCVLLDPLSDMVGGLEDAQQLWVVDFNMTSKALHGLCVWMLCMDCNHASTRGAASGLRSVGV